MNGIKLENNEVEPIFSCTWAVLCDLLENIYIGQIAKRRACPVFAFNMQNTSNIHFT